MKPNLNFHNEYTAKINQSNRNKALGLFNKMSESKPGLMQSAKVKITDNTDGTLFIYIGNVSAFDSKTEIIIKNFLNSIREF
jgi:hypothetical protein